MTQPAVKWSGEASSAAQIPYLMGRAAAEATSGRMGAVHLTIPVDAFAGKTDAPLRMPQGPAPAIPAPLGADVERALAALRAAERPVVIAGSGIWWGQAEEELLRFIRKTRLPLYTVTMARGAVSDAEPGVMGYADPGLNTAVRSVFQEADTVLVLGKRIDYRLALGGPRLFSANTKFIQVDIHRPELGTNRDIQVGICADVKVTLEKMLEAIGAEAWEPRAAWLERLRKCDAEARAYFEQCAASDGTPLHASHVFAEMRKALPANTLISWDGGDFAHWGRAMIPATVRGGWLRLGPMGTIGSALPNALSLQLANPDSPVIMITGDGALGFYLAELETAVRYDLPIVFVVGNDGGWGLERELQRELTGGPTVACELQRTRYDLIMQGFGGDGALIERREEIAPAVRAAFEKRRPTLLNVVVRGARSTFTEWQILGKKPIG
jgi:acetolactate synthase-1/2/3 large subunit